MRALLALGAAGAVTLGLPSSAQADDTVVVRGTAFPDASTQLAYVGCTDLLAPEQGRDPQALRPYIGRGPGQPPAGARSLGYDLAGGTAVGSQHVVVSMATTTTASLTVFAEDGARGLAVAGYQEPADAGSNLIWFGTAPVSAPAGAWHTVEAVPLAYTWTKYDMSTRTPVSAPSAPTAPSAPSSVAEFAATHGGDGPGLFAITFGCDGARFSMDAMRIGSPDHVRTYDIEGLATSLSMAGSAAQVTAGQEVTLHGVLRSSTGTRIPSATVILQRRTNPGDPWEVVRVVSADGEEVVARLAPTQSADYRWRFVDRPLAEGTVSPTFSLTVVPAATPDPSPAPEATPDASPEPQATPSPTPTPTLPAPPAEMPSPEPTTSESPSGQVSPDIATSSPAATEQPTQGA